jgi:alkyl hydroperoxide reductase subunit F
MLDNQIKTPLRAYLDKIRQPIEIVVSLDASAKAQEMLALANDIAELSDKVVVRQNGDSPRKPSFAIGRPGQPARISFAGIPMGHEFTSLILALLQTGGHPPEGRGARDRGDHRAIPGRFHFETFISLSCHNCPDVVQALNLMAVLNPGISHQMIDGALFQDEVTSARSWGCRRSC